MDQGGKDIAVDDSSERSVVCVFCGSSSGASPEYAAAAQSLAEAMASRGFGLVYGGGTIGLMGVVARTVHSRGGEVTGVIPAALAPREICGEGPGSTIVVDSMHQRKAKMVELADMFIALPGGFGTLEELFEVITWSQLSIHRKPIGVLNVAGYYDGLKRMISNAADEGFISKGNVEIVVFHADPSALLGELCSHVVPRPELDLTWT